MRCGSNKNLRSHAKMCNFCEWKRFVFFLRWARRECADCKCGAKIKSLSANWSTINFTMLIVLVCGLRMCARTVWKCCNSTNYSFLLFTVITTAWVTLTMWKNAKPSDVLRCPDRVNRIMKCGTVEFWSGFGKGLVVQVKSDNLIVKRDSYQRIDLPQAAIDIDMPWSLLYSACVCVSIHSEPTSVLPI